MSVSTLRPRSSKERWDPALRRIGHRNDPVGRHQLLARPGGHRAAQRVGRAADRGQAALPAVAADIHDRFCTLRTGQQSLSEHPATPAGASLAFQHTYLWLFVFSVVAIVPAIHLWVVERRTGLRRLESATSVEVVEATAESA